MDDNMKSFTMKYKASAVFSDIMMRIILMVVILVIVSTVAGAVSEEGISLGIIVLFFLVAAVLIVVYEVFYSYVWKCTVDGENIHYRSLFRERIITFSDIDRVSITRAAGVNRYGEGSSGITCVILYSHFDKKLFRVYAATTHYQDFIACLIERDIPGAKKEEKD